MTTRLTNRDLTIVSAHSGPEALTKLDKEDHVAVVILDVKMP
jgi:CheY-like chemotaxis protein